MRPKNPSFSHAELLSLISYEPDTGIFRWRGSHQRRKEKAKAGHFHAGIGYETIMVMGRAILPHRLAWFYSHSKWPDMYIDHINGDASDNRLCNLREANQSQNMANQHKLRKNNVSGFSWCIVAQGLRKMAGNYSSQRKASLSWIVSNKRRSKGSI